MPATPSMPTPADAPPRAHTEHVRHRLRALMDEHGLDGLLAMGSDNSYYVSGYANFSLARTGLTGGALCVLPKREDQPLLIVDAEYWVSSYPYDDNTVRIGYPTWIFIDNPLGVSPNPTERDLEAEASVDVAIGRLAHACADNGIKGRLGVDRTFVQYDIWTKITAALAPAIELVDATELFYEARVIKSDWEVEQLEAACQVTEKGVANALRILGPGTTSAHLHQAFLEGASSDPRFTNPRFDLITVGDNFAPVSYPQRTYHAQLGDLVKFDLGAEVLGYGADLARAYYVGTPTALVASRYEALLAGHEVLVKGAQPGRSLKDLFREVVDTVHAAGFTDYVRGHVGHSIGLFRGVEEPPQVAPGVDAVFEPGMVFSLETPYYAYGVGAINIEDTVHITDDGGRLLTHLPKHWSL